MMGLNLLMIGILTLGPGPDRPAAIDLNTASIDQLLAFPGIGRLYAEKIVQARPFESRSELVTREVMPLSAYLAIRYELYVSRRAEPAAASQSLAPLPEGTVDLNRASRDQLLDVPGIGIRYADRIIAGRPYRTEIELVGRRVLPLSVFNRVQGFLVARR